MLTAGIAGDGIMGQLLAFYLKQAGWHVTLFGSGKPNCSMAAAGMLAPVAELDNNEKMIYELGMDALHHQWPAILTQLASPVYFRQSGTITICHPSDLQELKRFVHHLDVKLNDVTLGQWQDQSGLQQLEPELTRFHTGYYMTTEGQLDNQALLIALRHYFQGTDWRCDDPVVCTRPHEIRTEKNAFHFDLTLDCRGLGAQSLFTHLHSVRGELLWLHAPDIHLSRPIRFLHPRYNLYIVPRPGNIYLVGASEIEAADESPVSVRTTLELLTAAYCVNPQFAEARILKTVTHCRPTLPDHLPRIKYCDGLIAVNGLYRHGYLIGPALAADVLRYVQQGHQAIRYQPLFEEILLDDTYTIQ